MSTNKEIYQNLISFLITTGIFIHEGYEQEDPVLLIKNTGINGIRTSRRGSKLLWDINGSLHELGDEITLEQVLENITDEEIKAKIIFNLDIFKNL